MGRTRTRHGALLGLSIAILLGTIAVSVGAFRSRPARPAVDADPAGAGGAVPSTTRADLSKTIVTMKARLAAKPADAAAAVRLTDALLRQARVAGDPALAVEAERVLTAVLGEAPDAYEARRMLGAVYLSQHRFREAIEAAGRARNLRPNDAWNYGVMGDGYVEIGDYDRAFDAFQQMVRLRPNAASYARTAYVRELQGDLDGALDAMRRAREATSAHDPEGQAWATVQVGQLYLQKGALDAAAREFERADFLFAGHPYAALGLARVAVARGDYGAALAGYQQLLARTPTPEIAAAVGDLLRLEGRGAEAQAAYARAVVLEREGWKLEAAQPAALARLLAERGLDTNEALRSAREAAAERRDIFTCDALAWALYRAGRVDEAARASADALRTGSKDRKLLYHAAAIAHAAGDDARASRLVRQALDGNRRFDLVAGPEAVALRARLGAGGAS